VTAAREYAKRFEPHLFEIFPDVEGALREAVPGGNTLGSCLVFPDRLVFDLGPAGGVPWAAVIAELSS
jgi:hypothetical protein